MSIRIVTDSTADLPETVIDLYGITVVPAYINIGETSYRDGIELTREMFYQSLPTYPSHPTTAAPAVGTFSASYQQLADEGASHILSIHIASSLSGILNAARLGAEAVPHIPVTLVDSQQLSMGIGLLVEMVAEEINAGTFLPAILQKIDSQIKRTHLFAVLDTLQFLRRSGRVNWAQFGLGTLLSIKPILKFHCGLVDLEQVRTAGRARQRLMALLSAVAPFSRLAFLHTHNLAQAQPFRDQLHPYFPTNSLPPIVEVTPVIGSHVGPGAIGLVGVSKQ